MPLKYQALSGGFTSLYLDRTRNNGTVGQLKIQTNSLTALYKNSHQDCIYFFLQGIDSFTCSELLGWKITWSQALCHQKATQKITATYSYVH
jgi:hypothetical protein